MAGAEDAAEGGSGLVLRRRLLSRLDGALTHRLTTIVADAGFGKSVLLDQWLSGASTADTAVVRPPGRDLTAVAGDLVQVIGERSAEEGDRLRLVTSGSSGGEDRPGALAGMVCAALARLRDVEVLLVLDDAEGLDPGAARFVERLCLQAPRTLHLVIASRADLPFTTDRMPDEVLSLTGTDLGFNPDELAEVLTATLGDDDHADAVRRLTGGWPAAVRLAAAALARRTRAERLTELRRLHKHGATFLADFAHQVVAHESPQMRRLSQVLAPYDGFSAELAEALGCEGAAETLADLESRGIVVRLGFDRFQFYAFPRLFRDFLREQLPMSPDERPRLVCRAAQWFEENGQAEGALRCAIDQRDSPWIARLVRDYGLALVADGRAARVSTALQLIDPQDVDAAVHEVAGAVRESSGDTKGALARYQAATEGRDQLPAGLAWRTGLLHYQLGQLEQALSVMNRARSPQETTEDALLQSWKATVLWARGEVDRAKQVAVPALALAERLDDPRAIAAAHTVLAMIAAHEGDRAANRQHYGVALVQAERAGDAMQVIRIRNNLGSRLLEEGELQASLAELEIAIELAEASGLYFYLSFALANRGELRFHLGQLDAATADLETARNLDQQVGSAGGSNALVHLGHVYRHRGYFTMSRLAYEEAIRAGRLAGDVNLVVPALCGLAQLLLTGDADLELAHQLTTEALSYDPGLGRVGALLAAGWVALARGETSEAHELAVEAHEQAFLRRDRMGRAEALHLLAVTDDTGAPDDPRLVEGVQLLDDVGAPVWRARLRLEQARRTAGPAGLQIVAEVEQLARSLGARGLADQAAALARDLEQPGTAPQVEIVTLGGFRVRRNGVTLGLTDWPDESARAVLKRLAAHPGAPWARGALARSLAPGATADGLAAALEQARRALDPDGLLDHDHFIVDTADTVILRNVEVDVHLFLEESARGLEQEDGRELLRRAEGRYGGDFLEEHPSEPWAFPLREEARGRYVEVSRALAADALRSGDPESAARYSRRILERDPYDEQAHLALVASLEAQARHPEARRCYSNYVQRLDELGLEAVPWGQATVSVPTR